MSLEERGGCGCGRVSGEGHFWPRAPPTSGRRHLSLLVVRLRSLTMGMSFAVAHVPSVFSVSRKIGSATPPSPRKREKGGLCEEGVFLPLDGEPGRRSGWAAPQGAGR